jgi:flagellar assembly factor FliW
MCWADILQGKRVPGSNTALPAVESDAEIRFPEGLPGFAGSGCFVLVYSKEYAPVYFLQSAGEPEVSLPVLPVHAVDPDYHLALSVGDRELLGLEEEPCLGSNLLCLVVLVLAASDKPPTCNLMAPIVVNPATSLAKQIVQIESDYPSSFTLEVSE